MNYFAKFEKFLPHSMFMPSLMTIGSQMPELDWGDILPPTPQYKIGSQNTPYKLGLKSTINCNHALHAGGIIKSNIEYRNKLGNAFNTAHMYKPTNQERLP